MTTRKKAVRKKASHASSKKTTRKKARRKKIGTEKQDAKSKQCACCLKRKPLDSFGKNSRMKLGRKSYCRDCSSKLQREWNKDQRKASGSKRKQR